MDDCILARPDLSMAEEIAAYRREFLQAGDSMAGCGALRRMEEPREWLSWCASLEKKETAPPNWAASTQYVYFRKADKKIIGMLDFRHENTFYGHVGYSVRPGERGKGYATAMLKAALDLYRERNVEKILVVCNQENEASRRTVLSCGGIYESTVTAPEDQEKMERYWINT